MALDKGWTDTVDKGVSDKAWDDHDITIKTEIDDYNKRLATTTGYVKVDWLHVKAMIWTESGGPTNASWKARAMQIGNSGDKGWAAIKAKEGAFPLVAPSDIASDPAKALDIQKPKDNIRAGIAYLFTRMCLSDIKVIKSAGPPKEYIFQKGDTSFSSIAKKLKTVPEVLVEMNPGKETKLNVGMKLAYVEAEKKRVIIGWTAFSTANIAINYNGGGDKNYGAKLDYVWGLFKKLVR
jgi:hypothetical protein